MRYVVVGAGNIGGKRKAVLGERCVATVDPFAPADHKAWTELAPDRYDAAILATPNEPKVEALRYFLDRGKHVLVEKPLVLDEATGADLAARAETNHAIWYTSYNFRFEPFVIALKERIASGAIGRVYRVRMFYGNGTARGSAGTWRDTKLGVLEDMATHLVDLTGFVFGRFGTTFRVWERTAHEMNGIDHAILASADRSIVIESSFCAWKNRWSIEVVGSEGNLRMEGLTKWGESTLTHEKRVFPSGAPVVVVEKVGGPDPTWAADLAHFEGMARRGETSLENDLWLTRTITAAASAPLEGDR